VARRSGSSASGASWARPTAARASSVLVHDDFQGRGLGFKLTDVIIGIAQEKGLREISGYIDANNRRMLRVVEELGFIAEETVDCVTTVRLILG